jgi:5,5'-dehydrodivanillate O-demethylase
VEQPGEGGASFAEKVRVEAYPTEEYLGHIFAYLGEGRPPALPRYPDLEDGVIEASRYARDCNYFNNVENGVDLFHVAWAHRDAHMEHSLDYQAGALSVEESDWGITASVTLRDGKVRTNQLGMPNILHFRSQPAIPGGRWTDVLGWRVPIDDECHQSFNVRVMHAAGKDADHLRERIRREPLKNPGRARELARAALRGEVRVRDLKGESQGILVNLQDDVTQVGQGAVANRDRELLGQTDEGVILLRGIWWRELKAMTEGRPLKEWRRPPSLLAASGA